LRQYETFELKFQVENQTSGYDDMSITAQFQCGKEQKTVRGFYDGNGVFKVRFFPDKAGEYTWKISGAVNDEGCAACESADDRQHGMVKAVGKHFEYEDGTRFIPFGTTVYALLHQEDALVEQTLKTLRHAPFNKIRMCLFPKDYDYNHNEPPLYPFEKKGDGSWDAGHPCLAFWNRLEKILDRINEMGIQVDLILFHPYDRWGFSSLTQKENILYLDYLLRRLSAKPGAWWSLANEYDLCTESKSLDDWKELEHYVAEHDPYGHLLSCHNCFCYWDIKRPNITHASLQTNALSEIPRWIAAYQKPVMIDECGYEGDLPYSWGSLSAHEMVRRFWRSYASGAYCTHGETFLSEDEVIWWAKGGELKGESSQRIAFLRSIIESVPGNLTPYDGMFALLDKMNPEQMEAYLADAPEESKKSFRAMSVSISRMDGKDHTAHFAGAHEWCAHAGEEAYLWYNDHQCYGEQFLPLPQDKTYQVEVVDTWNMTRKVLKKHVSGETVIHLPRKENLAVLAVREKN